MVKNEDDGGDWLESILRAEGRSHRSAYIDDDGFSAGVIGRLPQPVALPTWRQAAVVLMWLGAAVAAAMLVPDVFDHTFRTAVALFVGHRLGFADIAGLLGLLAVMTWGSVVYAMRTD